MYLPLALLIVRGFIKERKYHELLVLIADFTFTDLIADLVYEKLGIHQFFTYVVFLIFTSLYTPMVRKMIKSTTAASIMSIIVTAVNIIARKLLLNDPKFNKQIENIKKITVFDSLWRILYEMIGLQPSHFSLLFILFSLIFKRM